MENVLEIVIDHRLCNSIQRQQTSKKNPEEGYHEI